MDNKFKDDEIEEDIQIEEDEYEDEKNNNNIKTNTKVEESENPEEDLMYEDEYESVKDDILKSMNLLSSQSITIKNMQQKNKILTT